MEELGGIVSLVVQLAILGGIGWAVVQAVERRGGSRREGEGAVDRVASVRRFFVYGLMLTATIIGAIGTTMVGSALLSSTWSDRERRSLALGLAFMIVAAPAYAALLRFMRVRLRDDVVERTSLSWGGYLNIALATSLIVTTVTANEFLTGVFGADEFEWREISPVLVWSAVWAMHWFWLRRVYGLPGDLHLAIGSLTGLVTLVIGLGGVAYFAGDEIYALAVEPWPGDHRSSELAHWVVAAGIGAVVWGWHWLWQYWRAERTSLWHSYVLLIGVLGGLAATIASGATIAYWTTVWYLGNPNTTAPSEYFEHVPVTAAILLVGALTWQYHRAVLGTVRTVGRSEPLRVYETLMAAAGLVANVVGATVALVALFEAIAGRAASDSSEVANRLILAVILGVIGVMLWRVFWSRMSRQVEADPVAEIGSLTRRLYLVVVFGVGGFIALISLITVLFVGFEDLLDGAFGAQTLDAAKVGLALTMTVSGVAWYHLRVFRSDRTLAERFAPAPPLAPPTGRPAGRRVVLVAPSGSGLSEALSAATGWDVETWVRVDGEPMPEHEIDIDELARRVLRDPDHRVAVVVGPSGADVIPYVV